MSDPFYLFKHLKSTEKTLLIRGQKFTEDYLWYCTDLERTLKQLEAYSDVIKYAKVKYNKPEELLAVVNSAFGQPSEPQKKKKKA